LAFQKRNDSIYGDENVAGILQGYRIRFSVSRDNDDRFIRRSLLGSDSMIKTQFPYSHNGQDFLVSARCVSLDSMTAEGLKIKFIDEETLDYLDIEFSDRDREEFEEYCIEQLEEKNSEFVGVYEF
jgi:hypothetical protein